MVFLRSHVQSREPILNTSTSLCLPVDSSNLRSVFVCEKYVLSKLHNETLIPKTKYLNEHDFLIRYFNSICAVTNSFTVFCFRQLFLPSCTYPPRAPGTPLAVRYYSTELAPDMEEEEEGIGCERVIVTVESTTLVW